jgi:hypothetical protein
MLFDEVLELLDFWKLHPPPCDLLSILAQIKGWKPPEPPEEGNLAELLAMFPGGVIRGR